MGYRHYFNEEWNLPTSKETLIEKGCCCGVGCENCPYTKPIEKGNCKLINKL